MKSVQTIVITGASSGIGAALARYYAANGITLHLQGRNRGRLEKVAADCTKQGAHVLPYVGDVTDADAMQEWLTNADNETPIDLVIANAGISAGLGLGGESAEQAREIFRVNIDGVMNTISPLIPRMAARKRGHIAMMGSLAGVRGLPSSPAYSGSKGWVRIYGEGLRGWLKKERVAVTVICPGFIKTPLTDTNPYPMPFLMSSEKAARIIARGLARKKGMIAFPLALYAPLWLASLLPAFLSDTLFGKLPAKPSNPALVEKP